MIELFLWRWGLYLIIIWTFLFNGCSPISPDRAGYWVNDGPYRGTLRANRAYVRPYWNCIDKTLDCSNE